VLGSIVIFALPAVLHSLFPQTSSGGLRIDDITSIVYGLLIIAFFVFEPGGVVGLARRVLRLWRGAGEGGPPTRQHEGEEHLQTQEQSIERRVPTWAK
jgi:branched-chain amino acid transport system permease protein